MPSWTFFRLNEEEPTLMSNNVDSTSGFPRRPPRARFQDPLLLITDVRTRAHTLWLRFTYPFHYFGRGVSIRPSCEIRRTAAPGISLGDQVYLAPDVWLNVESDSGFGEPAITLAKGCRIGRRCIISAKNQIRLENDVLLAPSVLIMDHNHEYSDPDTPIHSQGTTPGGRIVIGRNCWLGYGSVVFCGSGTLELGHNSVVGANSVLTRSFPANSVVAGTPAKLVKRYDPSTGRWVRGEGAGCDLRESAALDSTCGS